MRARLCVLLVLAVSAAFGAADGLEALDDDIARMLREATSGTEAAVAESGEAAERRDAWGRLGMLFHSQHLPFLAEGFYGRALDEEASSRWHYLRGVVRSEQGKLNEALVDYRNAVELEPALGAAWYRLGAAHLVSGDVDAAATALDEARKRMPDSALVLMALGDCAVARGEFEPARQLFTSAHELAPEATQIAYKLAMVHRRLGDLDAARRWLEKRGDTNTQPAIDDPVLLEVAQLSQSERFYMRAGEWALERGEVGRAVEAFARAVDLAPEDENASFGYAQALVAAERLADAVAAVERVVERRPQSARGWYTLGWLQQDEPQSALTAVRTSLELEDDPQARSLAAALAMKAAQYGDAALDYAVLASADPSQAYFQYWHGMALAGSGDCDARSSLERAIALQRGWGEAHLSLARMEAICGAGEAAEARARALLRARDDDDTRLTLAFALVGQKRVEQARELIAALPEHPDARLLRQALQSGELPAQPFSSGSERWIPAEAQSLHRK